MKLFSRCSGEQERGTHGDGDLVSYQVVDELDDAWEGLDGAEGFLKAVFYRFDQCFWSHR